MSEIFKEEYEKIRNWLNRYKPIKYILFLIIIFTMIAGSYQIITGDSIISLFSTNYSITDNELKEQTLEIKTEIIIFANDREKYQPQIDFNNWENSTNAYLDYNIETGNQWDLRFASKVQFLYGEFQKRNMKVDRTTEILIENPGGSSSWMKTIAIKLGKLAYQI